MLINRRIIRMSESKDLEQNPFRHETRTGIE